MRKLLLIFIYTICIRYFLKYIIGVQFDNSDFLLKEKQFIIVANHNSHLDALSIMASLPGSLIHKVKPVAAKDYFGKTRLKEKLSNYFINTLLIDRKKNTENPEEDPVYKMDQVLKKGFSLIVFPEGSRGNPDIVQPLKKGVAYVLLSNKKVNYIPAYLKGMGKALPKGDNLLVPHTASLAYGAPRTIHSEDAQEIINQMQADIFELKEKDL